MTAPATTARTAPAGIKVDDGYQTLVAFAADADVSFWEKTLQPPGLDGGDPVETTTMHNTTWRTFGPRALITTTECSVVAAYDPDVYNQIIAILNVRGAITVHFPDGSTLDFYGYLRTFDPQSCEEGAQPEANIVIQPTNYDPVAFEEEAPVLTSAPGT